MSRELLYTPPAEAEWIHLIDPRPQYDPTKPLAWTCNLLFHSDHDIFKILSDKIHAIHDKKNTNLEYPWKPHKKREGILALKFKAVQLTRKDGTPLPGPRIVDAKKQPWTAGFIGNGSVMRICYSLYPYDHGVTLIPKSAQVLDFVPISDGAEGFEEDETGYVQDDLNSEEGW